MTAFYAGDGVLGHAVACPVRLRGAGRPISSVLSRRCRRPRSFGDQLDLASTATPPSTPATTNTSYVKGWRAKIDPRPLQFHLCPDGNEWKVWTTTRPAVPRRRGNHAHSRPRGGNRMALMFRWARWSAPRRRPIPRDDQDRRAGDAGRRHRRDRAARSPTSSRRRWGSRSWSRTSPARPTISAPTASPRARPTATPW